MRLALPSFTSSVERRLAFNIGAPRRFSPIFRRTISRSTRWWPRHLCAHLSASSCPARVWSQRASGPSSRLVTTQCRNEIVPGSPQYSVPTAQYPVPQYPSTPVPQYPSTQNSLSAHHHFADARSSRRAALLDGSEIGTWPGSTSIGGISTKPYSPRWISQ